MLVEGLEGHTGYVGLLVLFVSLSLGHVLLYPVARLSVQALPIFGREIFYSPTRNHDSHSDLSLIFVKSRWGIRLGFGSAKRLVLQRPPT